MHLFVLDKSAIQNNIKRTKSLRLFLAGCHSEYLLSVFLHKKYRCDIFSELLSSNIIILCDVSACSRIEISRFLWDIQSESVWFNLQIDTLNSCLFTYNTFIKLLYLFRALTLLIIRRSTS
jgi:hypothetical protein